MSDLVVPIQDDAPEPGSFYSTADAVRDRTGVRPEDLGMDTDDESRLTDFLEALLAEVTDLADRMMRKSYLEEDTIPAGLSGIAADVASDSIREMVATRQTPIFRIDDFAVRIIQTRMFSPDARERLKLYTDGGGVASLQLKTGHLAHLRTGSTLASDLEGDVE